MMRRLLPLLALGALLLPGQVQRVEPANIMIFPPPGNYFDDLKQYLGLSDTQLEELRRILADRDAANRTVGQQIGEKHRELNTLLEGGSNDAVRIGTLTIEIRNLQKQLNSPSDPFRQRALAVLTPEQRTKLASLAEAQKLQGAVSQAVMLFLLEPPPPSPPVILGRPGALGTADLP